MRGVKITITTTILCLLLALSLLSGCKKSQDTTAGTQVQKMMDDSPAGQAITDLAARLGVSPSEIELVSEEAVTWRAGSLGCPKKGMMYTEALVDGQLIVLRVSGTDYRYHSGKGRAPFYCKKPRDPAPKSSLD